MYDKNTKKIYKYFPLAIEEALQDEHYAQQEHPIADQDELNSLYGLVGGIAYDMGFHEIEHINEDYAYEVFLHLYCEL